MARWRHRRLHGLVLGSVEDACNLVDVNTVLGDAQLVIKDGRYDRAEGGVEGPSKTKDTITGSRPCPFAIQASTRSIAEFAIA